MTTKRTKINFGVIVLESGETKLLYVHEVPVAAYTPHDGLIQTDINYDDATTRRIAEFLNGHAAKVVPQEYIDDIENGVVVD